MWSYIHLLYIPLTKHFLERFIEAGTGREWGPCWRTEKIILQRRNTALGSVLQRYPVQVPEIV